MLTYVQCNSCHGVYAPTQADGTLYFHRCPPVLQYYDGAGTPITPLQAKAAFALLQPVFSKPIDPPTLRDENVVPPAYPGAPAGMKAAGLGVSPAAVPIALQGATVVTSVP